MARERQHEYARENWRSLSLFFVIILIPVPIMAIVIPSQFGRGLAIGATLAWAGTMAWFWIVQATGTAPTMMGDEGERWTSAELRRLQRSGWLLVNHVKLKAKDIDHVLVGPGGVITVETKWSAQAWSWDPIDPRIRQAAESVRGDARSLGLWTDLKRVGVGSVRPVVFLWGGAARNIPEGAELDGVQILSKRTVRAWRDSLRGDQRLRPEQIEAAWSALDARCQVEDPLEGSVPTSLGGWLARAVVCVVTAYLAALAVSAPVSLGIPWVLSLVWWLAMAAAGLAATRNRRFGYLGIAWTVGMLGAGTYVAAVLLA